MDRLNQLGSMAARIAPTSNIVEAGYSVLPKRFIDGSEFQQSPIVGQELGSTSVPIFQPAAILIPTNVLA